MLFINISTSVKTIAIIYKGKKNIYKQNFIKTIKINILLKAMEKSTDLNIIVICYHVRNYQIHFMDYHGYTEILPERYVNTPNKLTTKKRSQNK